MLSIEERDELITKNQRLMYWAAGAAQKKYAVDYDELLSAVGFAMIKAASAFNPELGIKFPTFYMRCFQNEVLMHLRRQRKWSANISLDLPITTDIDGSELTIRDIATDGRSAEDIALSAIQLVEARQAIATLKPFARRCIADFANGVTQAHTASSTGKTQSYVSRTLRKAQKKLLDYRDGKIKLQKEKPRRKEEPKKLDQKSEIFTAKVQGTGMVAIPAKLVKAFGLSVGDAVDIFTSGGRIVAEKSIPRCLICGARAGMIGGKQVCQPCAETIAKAIRA